jgi:protein-S-isoprenylcysteine O-methyltransferase Ste14
VTVGWEAALPATLLVGSVASFGWGVRKFFTRPVGLTARMKWISGLSCAFGIAHLFAILFSSNLTPERSVAGSALYLCSAGLFWWAIRTSLGKPLSAAFSPDVPLHLVCNGPYRFVRHPLYTSYLLTWVAGWVVTAQWWLLPTVLAMLGIYFVASSAEEEKFLSSPLGRDYQRYRLRTGRFLPNAVKLVAGLTGQVEPRTSEPGA